MSLGWRLRQMYFRSPGRSLPPTFLVEGTLLNARYRIEGFLGAGGFAAVYKAQDIAIKRPVAIKVLCALAANPDPRKHNDLMQRFQHEATAMAQIRHPNVVTVYDIGVTDDDLQQPYIVMELMEGHDLDEELEKHGPIAPKRALKLLIRCLEALDIGHRRGIVHKDLKPSNLYIEERGTRNEALRILDFGIARLQEEDAALTGTGQIMGTPQYLSPEYVSDQIVTPALDVYQMGLLLVEMLSGNKVVGSENPIACALIHKTGELELPLSLLSGPLGPIITRALSLDPEARYADAGSFADALSEVDPTGVQVEPGGPKRTLKETTQSLRAAAFIQEPHSTDDIGPKSGATAALPLPDDDVPLEERLTIQAPSIRAEALRRPASVPVSLYDQPEATVPFAPPEIVSRGIPALARPPVDHAPPTHRVPIQNVPPSSPRVVARRQAVVVPPPTFRPPSLPPQTIPTPPTLTPAPTQPRSSGWLLYVVIGIVFVMVAAGLLGVVAFKSSWKDAQPAPAPIEDPTEYQESSTTTVPPAQKAQPVAEPPKKVETIAPNPPINEETGPEQDLTPEQQRLLGVEPLPEKTSPPRTNTPRKTDKVTRPARKAPKKAPKKGKGLEIYDF